MDAMLLSDAKLCLNLDADDILPFSIPLCFHAAEEGNEPVKAINYAHSLSSRSNVRKHRRNNRAAGPKGVLVSLNSLH